MTTNEPNITDLIRRCEADFGPLVSARTARRLVACSLATLNRAVRTGDIAVFGRRGRRGGRLFETSSLILWAWRNGQGRSH